MPMPNVSELPGAQLDVLVGGDLSTLAVRPLPAYSDEAVAFLGALSHHLLAQPEVRHLPDVVTFAYWCRPAHVRRLAAERQDGRTHLGRGLALHIAPANVPVNFAFSLVFGMLAGNANIVRLPDTTHAQGRLICQALRTLLAQPEHARLAAMNRVVAYPRNDEVTRALSAASQVRVLWGGDQTIAHLRQMPTPPRAVDVAFADRYSMCVLGADGVRDASDAVLQRLVQDFYNDTYLMDQNACSSPHLVYWLGHPESVARAKPRFWAALAEVVRQRYPMAPITAIDKFSRLCDVAAALPAAGEVIRSGNWLYRVPLQVLPADLDTHRCGLGVFYEYEAKDLASLAMVVNERHQTVTCFGVDRQVIVDAVVNAGLLGVDRVVPVGRALDIGVYWDGYDLIGTLSRVIGDS